MKKNIIKSITFISLSILVVFLSGFIIPRVSAKEQRCEGYMLEANNDLDIIAFGNSDLYSGLIPSVLYDKYGYRSYNTGESQQHLERTYKRIKKALEYQSPELIIIETDVLTYDVKDTNNGDISKNFFVNIYNNHDYWRMKNSSEIIDMKGYVFSSECVPCYNENYMEKNNNMPDINDEAFIILGKINELCKSKNIKVLLVEMPSATTWSNNRHNQVLNFSASNGLNFIDFNKIMIDLNIDLKTDSRDGGNHLNVYGAEKVSNYLADYIKDNYHINGNDKNDESFNKSLDLYKRKLRSCK